MENTVEIVTMNNSSMKSVFAALCAAVATMSALAEVWPDGSQMDAWFADRAPIDEAKLGHLRRAEEFGARPDCGEMQTVALQRGIDAIAADGGGVLVLGPGVWNSSSLFFKPGVHFKLEKDAVLKGPADGADTPRRMTRLVGLSFVYNVALVNADRCDGFTLYGDGMIDGNGAKTWIEFWERRKSEKGFKDWTQARPRNLYVSNSRNVRLSGVSLKDSHIWTTHFYKCSRVKIDGVRITAPGPKTPPRSASTDAIDFDAVTDAHVWGAYLDVNDDAIALKGGKYYGCEKMPDNGPNVNILVEDCVFGPVNHSALTCGSEAFHCRNIVLRNSEIRGDGWLLHIKSRPDTRQLYEHILVDNITGECGEAFGMLPWTQWFELPPGVGKQETRAVDVVFRNCKVKFRGRESISLDPSFMKLEGYVSPAFSDTSLRFVDPLIGTEGKGSQYGGMMPCTGVPFGSFHMVPMTRLNRVGQLSFNSSDDTLIGFILTRQPAIWMGDWGEVRIPIEPSKIERAEYAPHLGRVTAGGRMFEYTATAHAAWLRGDMKNIRLLDGYCSNRDDENLGRALPNFKGWRCVKRVKDGLQIGVSLISLDQARKNLEAEIGSRSFDEVADATKVEWERYFSRIEIDAPDEMKTIFYTGLYHTLLYPRRIDEQGRYYSAFDDRVHEGTMYSCYSLWDTYRAEHPWLTLIAPERVDGMMQSLLEMYREGGWLPKWPNPGYTGIMTGAPAEIVLEEAMMKGFCGFDHSLAREAIKKNRTVPQRFDAEREWYDREQYGEYPETRAGLTSYLNRGYVACDRTSESVSRTLDFSLADRNRNYTNLWCEAAGMFLPKRADGSFDANAHHAYTECRPETAVWCVPHDPEGLADLMGGKESATRRLDEFFDKLFWIPERGNKSIHGNEPSHHCAYLYNRFGHPEKTQQRVREILTRAYSTNRKGFDGNEDCGQMSAWYILSALGIYPLDPVSGHYEIGSPLVKGARLRLGYPYNTAVIEIRVKGYAPDRWRVKRVMLNGNELKDWRVSHADLVKGGVMEFEMDSLDNP